MNKIIVPPIKCQGIKTKIVSWILENAPLPVERRWIEPFMGSGVVGFSASQKEAIFNDLNPHIINFYNALKSREVTPENTRVFLEYEGGKLREKGETYYYMVRERFNKYHNPLDFLFLSRASFNGVIRFNSKGYYNVPFCKKRERFSKAYITKIVNQVSSVCEIIRMNNWEFQCRDFTDLIAEVKRGDFLYCDPPYFGRHVDYYNLWSEQDEYNLSTVLKKTKGKFILSTWYSNKYRVYTSINKYWKEFNILTREHFYHVGSKEEYRNPVTEALILNYEPITPSSQEIKSRQFQLSS